MVKAKMSKKSRAGATSARRSASQLADIANTGTLCAFFVVALGVLILRLRDPERRRTFRAPLLWVVGPLAIFGCLFLFSQLSTYTELLFVGWTLAGILVYVAYGYRRSHLARYTSPVVAHEDSAGDAQRIEQTN